MRQTHELKILKDFADAVISGDKTFEIRENDRGFQRGDHVIFTVVPTDIDCSEHPIHNRIYKITYVLNGWGLKNGYVTFGIRDITKVFENDRKESEE